MATVDKIVRSAHHAYLASQQASLSERAGWILASADALEGRRKDLVDMASAETHLPHSRLDAELSRTVFQLKLLAEEVQRGEFLDATIDYSDESWGMGPRPDIRRVNVPLGVVAVFGASNFPFAFSVAGGDTASALAAGCSVVHKIHEGHEKLGALTVEIMTKALLSVGAPAGIFAGLTGRQEGIDLVEHPLVKAVGFTGSVSGGRALFDRAANRPEPIPFFGELGSMNPVIVTEAAWTSRAGEIVEGFTGSLLTGNGQFCTKPGLLFLPDAALADARHRFEDALLNLELPGKMLNERIAEGFHVSREMVAGIPSVNVLISGGQTNPPSPTVFAVSGSHLAADSEVLHREMFGPGAVLISYRDRSHLLQLIESLHGQLTGTLHSEEHEITSEIIEVLQRRCGRLVRNGWPTGVTVSYAQNHGGPYPATTAAGTTSVGTAALRRFLRPVAFQGFSQTDLPEALQDGNPLALSRRVNGVMGTS